MRVFHLLYIRIRIYSRDESSPAAPISATGPSQYQFDFSVILLPGTEPEFDALFLPFKWEACVGHEFACGEFGRLVPGKDRLDDVGRQEGEADNPDDVGSRHAEFAGDVFERGGIAFHQVGFDPVCFDNEFDERWIGITALAFDMKFGAKTCASKLRLNPCLEGRVGARAVSCEGFSCIRFNEREETDGVEIEGHAGPADRDTWLKGKEMCAERL